MGLFVDLPHRPTVRTRSAARSHPFLELVAHNSSGEHCTRRRKIFPASKFAPATEPLGPALAYGVPTHAPGLNSPSRIQSANSPSGISPAEESQGFLSHLKCGFHPLEKATVFSLL